MAFLGDAASTATAASKTKFTSILSKARSSQSDVALPKSVDILDIPRQSAPQSRMAFMKAKIKLPEKVTRHLKRWDWKKPTQGKMDFSALMPKNMKPREFDKAPPMSPEVEARVKVQRAERAKRLETQGHVAVWGEMAFDRLVPAAREAVAPRKAGMTSDELQHLSRLQSQLLDERKVKEMHPDELEKLVSEFETKTSPEALDQIMNLRPHDRYPYSTTNWSLSDTLNANRQKADVKAAKEAFLKEYPNINSLPLKDRATVLESLDYLRNARPDCEWTYEGHVRSEMFPSKHWAQVREEARAKHPIVQYSHKKLQPKDLGYEGNDMRGPEVYESLPQGGTRYVSKYQAIYQAHGGGSSFGYRNT